MKELQIHMASETVLGKRLKASELSTANVRAKQGHTIHSTCSKSARHHAEETGSVARESSVISVIAVAQSEKTANMNDRRTLKILKI